MNLNRTCLGARKQFLFYHKACFLQVFEVGSFFNFIMGRPGIYILCQFIILILWHGLATSVQDEAVLLPTVPQLHNGIRPNLTSSCKFLAPVLLYANHNCCFQPVVNTIALANDIELNPGPLSSTHNSSQYSGLSDFDTSINESSLSSQHVQEY